MPPLIYLFVLSLGLIVGSFLNVIIYRFGRESITGRSRCFTCGNTLQWWELLPVLSFIYLRGKCRSCKSTISLQYPLVELAAGLLFVWIFKFVIFNSQFSFFTTKLILLILLNWAIWSSLLVIFVYDLKHKIIPNSAVYLFIFLSLLQSLFLNTFINHSLAAFILFLFIFTLWFVSKGQWIGYGDAKLSLGIGFYLGVAKGISAVALGFWVGAVIGIILILFEKLSKKALSKSDKSLTIKSAIPFGPFLILGTLLSFIFSLDIFSINFLFS